MFIQIVSLLLICRHNVQLWCSDGLVSCPRMFGLVCFTTLPILLCMDCRLWLHICISGYLYLLVYVVAFILLSCYCHRYLLIFIVTSGCKLWNQRCRPNADVIMAEPLAIHSHPLHHTTITLTFWTDLHIAVGSVHNYGFLWLFGVSSLDGIERWSDRCARPIMQPIKTSMHILPGNVMYNFGGFFRIIWESICSLFMSSCTFLKTVMERSFHHAIGVGCFLVLREVGCPYIHGSPALIVRIVSAP